MPKSHRPYPPEYRERIIELVRTGRSPESLGREFEPSAQWIRTSAERLETAAPVMSRSR
jgi:transposase